MRTEKISSLDLDRPRLLEELKQIADFKYSHAYSDYLCGGPWRSCMLWSSGGEAGDGFITNYDERQPASKTEYGAQLPYLAEVVERSFNIKYLNFARLAIISNSVIIPHKDLLEVNRLLHRVHVPLITNEHCYFSEGNIVYRMKFGEVWSFDATRMHSAASFSEDERLHLILDFVYVDDPAKLMHFPLNLRGGIPAESICARSPLTDEEREAIMSLASVIDTENYREVFGIAIKKHYRRDGGENFIWDTMLKIATLSGKPQVETKIKEMYNYFLVKRAAASS